jgi:MFS family permease
MMISRLRPQEKLSESELQSGLRMLIFDGIFSQIMGTFAGGAFLVAFALLLGASNFVIGLIAALGPLTQILQIPTIYIIEKIKYRKVLVVMSSFFSRLFWFLVAAVPLLFINRTGVNLFLFALTMYFALGTISGLSFNSWLRDLIPESIRGSYMAKRSALATSFGATLGLFAGIGVDIYKKHAAEIGIYSIYFFIAGCAGLLGVYFLSRIPEPKMESNSTTNLSEVILEPFKDTNFLQLLIFLGSWNFAINLAAPFFTVYMLKRLKLSMTLIIAFSVLSQIFNVLSLRLWGLLADRYSNKSVLTETGPLFILTIALWPFTTMPESYFLTIPLVILIHILAGISTAGVNLCTGNIALKLAPNGKATSYLAVNALVSGIAATIAPILGGWLGTILDGERLSLTLSWMSKEIIRWRLPTVELMGLDFLFIISLIFGLYSMHRLLAVKEQGEVEERIVSEQIHMEMRKTVRNISNVAGIRDLFYFPYAVLQKFLH